MKFRRTAAQIMARALRHRSLWAETKRVTRIDPDTLDLTTPEFAWPETVTRRQAALTRLGNEH